MPENFRYTNGLGHVPSYQASAVPFLTSSLVVPASGSTPLQISFPAISRFVIITNNTPAASTNVPMRFGFSANGVSGIEESNYGILNNGESFEAEFRVVSVYLMTDTVNECTGSVIAGLTRVSSIHLTDNWSGSAGVG